MTETNKDDRDDNDMLDFMNNCIDPLGNTQRWTTYDTIDAGSVAEHSFIVAHIAYQIALYEDDCDENEVVKRALFHDVEESYTGDLPRFSKRENDDFANSLEQVEKDAVEQMLKDTHIEEKEADEIKRIWEEGKEEGKEGEVLTQADILAAVYDIYREVLKGNKRLRNNDAARGIKYAIKVCEGTPIAEEMLEGMLDEIGWENGKFTNGGE